MSDLSMYEFGDIVWDEFCQSEDHIVPHPVGEAASEQLFVGDSRKKPRHQFSVLGNSKEQSAKDIVCQEKDLGNTSVLNNRRKIMLEKNSWSDTPDGIFPSSCNSNSVKEVPSLASDSARASSHCFKSSNTDLLGNELCTTDSMLIDESAAVDSNSYNYPLDPLSQTDDDLSFFDSDQNGKDSSDFLYYSWPDIGNFEDVDRMFRSCDSTFGLGASNEDELGWFSSSDAIGGSADALKSEFKASCPASGAMAKNSENHEPVGLNDTCCSLNDTSFEVASVSCKNNSWSSDKDESDTFGDMSGTRSYDSKDNYRPRKQAVELNNEVQQRISATNISTTGSTGMSNVHKKQQKNQSRYDSKRKNPYGGSFYYNGSLPTEDKEAPFEATSDQSLPSGGIQQQKQASGPESFGYLQNDIPYMQDCSHISDHTSIFPTLSAVKSDTNGFRNISPKESSYSSNQVLSSDSSHSPAFQLATGVHSEKREIPHHQQPLQSSFSSKAESMEMGVQVPLCDPVSVEKKVQYLGKNFESHTDGEGVPGEFGSSTMQESSSASSGLDEISLEAASFRQLQLVMEQLDLRTKLCIRDSLYRLAQSAEQRHNQANLKGSYSGDNRDARGVPLAEGTNKCTGFMDMETGTNPIDRSIAHLLFHRPSESPIITAQDSLSLKSPTLMEPDPIEVTKNGFMVLSVVHL
ncbi:protein LNK1 isoform X1 [Coffea eugenioides]|uniref:protein LNK1 isoform X1 n=1 Tax=Coffea eugenioides TaxID=49369 RepID=UPI000F608636|nr:protein LNK1 isoform X1 [Coffea eugenioides]